MSPKTVFITFITTLDFNKILIRLQTYARTGFMTHSSKYRNIIFYNRLKMSDFHNDLKTLSDIGVRAILSNQFKNCVIKIKITVLNIINKLKKRQKTNFYNFYFNLV